MRSFKLTNHYLGDDIVTNTVLTVAGSHIIRGSGGHFSVSVQPLCVICLLILVLTD